MTSESRRAMVIDRAWCTTAAGNGVVAAFGAALTPATVAKDIPAIQVMKADGHRHTPAYTAPCPALADADASGAERLPRLLGETSRALAANGGLTARAEPGRIVIALPPAGLARGRDIDSAQVEDAFRGALPDLEHCPIELPRAEQGTAPLLRAAEAVLREEGVPWLLFGAVDSLIESRTLRTLADAGRLRGQGVEGILPGEACVLLALRLADPDDPDELEVRMDAMTSAQTGAGEDADVAGLKEAIAATLAAAGLYAAQLSLAFHDLPADRAGALAWHSVVQRFWPPRLNDELRRAQELGLLSAPEVEDPAPPMLHIGEHLGDVGCASLPLQLALTRQWARYTARAAQFHAGAAPPYRILVTETGAGESASALGLTAGAS